MNFESPIDTVMREPKETPEQRRERINVLQGKIRERERDLTFQIREVSGVARSILMLRENLSPENEEASIELLKSLTETSERLTTLTERLRGSAGQKTN